MSSRFWRSSIACSSFFLRLLYVVLHFVVVLMSFDIASQNVFTVWCTFAGSQLLLCLKICSSVVSCVCLLPKCARSLIRRKNSSVSLVNILSLYFPGVGQKLRFFPNNLNTGILNLCLERFITLPVGSAEYLDVF